MAPDIRQHAELRQTNAATSTASLILVRITPPLNARTWKTRVSHVSTWQHTYRTKVNLTVTINSTESQESTASPAA